MATYLPFAVFPMRGNISELCVYALRGLGVNDAALTIEEPDLSQGMTCTRTGEGAYKLTWAASPGTFVGWDYGLGAATPDDLKGYTVVRDTYDTTAFALEFTVFNASVTAADLIANQYIDIRVWFHRTAPNT